LFSAYLLNTVLHPFGAFSDAIAHPAMSVLLFFVKCRMLYAKRMENDMAELKCPNVTECPCPNESCDNYGKCCACVVNHRTNGNLPVCLRELTPKAQ